MPFSDSALSALTTANGFTLWHYRTQDDRAAVLAPGYFSAAAQRLLPGDIVIVQAADVHRAGAIRGGRCPLGVTVDGSGSAPALLRSATFSPRCCWPRPRCRRVILDVQPGSQSRAMPCRPGRDRHRPIVQ